MVVGKIIEQNFILKILGLKITSKKILLIFLFIRFDTVMIKQSSNYILKSFPHQLAFEIFNEISQSNIFLFNLLFFRAYKVNSIFIISRSAFWSVSSISIGSFSSSLFFSDQLLLYLIKVLVTGWPVFKIFLMEYTRHCVFWLHSLRFKPNNIIPLVRNFCDQKSGV